MRAYLERSGTPAGGHRFYSVMVMPTLFGEWSLLREWGRLGCAGTVRLQGYGSEDEAVAAARALVATKRRCGYADR